MLNDLQQRLCCAIYKLLLFSSMIIKIVLLFQVEDIIKKFGSLKHLRSKNWQKEQSKPPPAVRTVKTALPKVCRCLKQARPVLSTFNIHTSITM